MIEQRVAEQDETRPEDPWILDFLTFIARNGVVEVLIHFVENVVRVTLVEGIDDVTVNLSQGGEIDIAIVLSQILFRLTQAAET